MPGKTTPRPAAEALQRVLDVTRRLAEPYDLTTMLTAVVDAARAVLRAERGAVFLYDAAVHELTTSVATGAGTLRIPADRGIVGECLRTRQVINVPDCYADARFNRDVDRTTGYKTRCLLAVPLVGHDDSLVGVLQVLNKVGGVFNADDEPIAVALGAQCAVALQRTRMLQEILAKEKMERELAVARDIQMRVLPRVLPVPSGYDIAATSRPADQTGGDIYDVVPIAGNRLLLLLGDATGHGIGPALSVTQVRAMLRMAVRLGAGLDASFANINDQLCDDLADNRFVTCFLGELDTETHRLAFHSGGQGPILHFHAADRSVEWLGTTSMPMGFIAGLPLKPPKIVDLGPGDVLALITDGIYECASRAGEEFGRDRVGDLVREGMSAAAGDVVRAIVEAADAHVAGGPQADDMTIVLLRRSV